MLGKYLVIFGYFLNVLSEFCLFLKLLVVSLVFMSVFVLILDIFMVVICIVWCFKFFFGIFFKCVIRRRILNRFG